jgi:peroxiredoxin
MVRSSLIAAVAALSMLAAAPAHAALAIGAKAPALDVKGAHAGKAVDFSLAESLKKGPVVLYFFPKANTGGCDLEAKLFGEASADFAAAGASVVGASKDNVETLTKYSAEKCAGKFPVVSVGDKAVESFDVKGMLPVVTSRTTYVIAPDNTVLMSFTGPPAEHPVKSLEAVKAWKAKNP